MSDLSPQSGRKRTLDWVAVNRDFMSTHPQSMQPETRLLLMEAIRQCRAELMATQSWLRDEVAELRKELAAARAELHRLRAIDTQRDPDAPLN